MYVSSTVGCVAQWLGRRSLAGGLSLIYASFVVDRVHRNFVLLPIFYCQKFAGKNFSVFEAATLIIYECNHVWSDHMPVHIYA